MPGKLLSIVIGLIGALWLGIVGGWAVYWWATQAPAGWPNIKVPVLFWHLTLSLPDGPGAQLIKLRAQIDDPKTGWKVRLGQCDANGATLERAIGEQNVSIARSRAAGDALVAESERRVAARLAGLSRGQAARDAISAQPPAGADICARVLDVDRKFVESLR